jgi:hypothetical protein
MNGTCMLCVAREPHGRMEHCYLLCQPAYMLRPVNQSKTIINHCGAIRCIGAAIYKLRNGHAASQVDPVCQAGMHTASMLLAHDVIVGGLQAQLLVLVLLRFGRWDSM